MKTKLYSIITGLVIALSSVSQAMADVVNYGEELTNIPDKVYTQSFTDVSKSHWAFEHIEEMSDRGVLTGYPDGKFYPNINVTRAQFATIMTRAAGLKIGTTSYSSLISYEDVPTDSWYYPYVEASRFYLSGYVNDGKLYYLPENNALREDIAVALVKLKGYSTDGYDLSILQTMFSDWQSISSGAQPYVATAVEKGLISGYEDGTFKGQQGITRAEAATLLWRAYQYGNSNKVFEQEVIETPKPSKEPEYIKEPKPTETPKQENTPKPTNKPVITDPDNDYEEDNTTPVINNEPVEEPKEDPKPSYGWKISTIKNGVNSIKYSQTVPNGLSYMTLEDNKIFEVNDNGKVTVIFDANDFKYVGDEELSKRDTVNNKLRYYGYNKYDNCYYAVVIQNSRFILYNVTNDEIICNNGTTFIEETDSLTTSPELKFYENGDFQLGCPIYFGKKITNNGKIIGCDGFGGADKYLILSNTSYEIANNNTIIGVDCEDPGWRNFSSYDESIMIGYDRFYRIGNKSEITSLDINGDKHFLLSFDDIENKEGREYDPLEVIGYGAITDDESAIYFYDNSYGSIRKIERNK